jgi:hypothetical protein
MKRSTRAFVIVACLLFHIALLAYAATCASPTTLESSAMVAGVCHWKTGRHDLFQVNPPLVRMWATIPVLLAMPDVAPVNCGGKIIGECLFDGSACVCSIRPEVTDGVCTFASC